MSINDKDFYYGSLSVIERSTGFVIGKKLFSKIAGFIQVVAMSETFPSKAEAEFALPTFGKF